jgi:hypothetical protein
MADPFDQYNLFGLSDQDLALFNALPAGPTLEEIVAQNTAATIALPQGQGQGELLAPFPTDNIFNDLMTQLLTGVSGPTQEQHLILQPDPIHREAEDVYKACVEQCETARQRATDVFAPLFPPSVPPPPIMPTPDAGVLNTIIAEMEAEVARPTRRPRNVEQAALLAAQVDQTWQELGLPANYYDLVGRPALPAAPENANIYRCANFKGQKKFVINAIVSILRDRIAAETARIQGATTAAGSAPRQIQGVSGAEIVEYLYNNHLVFTYDSQLVGKKAPAGSEGLFVVSIPTDDAHNDTKIKREVMRGVSRSLNELAAARCLFSEKMGDPFIYVYYPQDK